MQKRIHLITRDKYYEKIAMAEDILGNNHLLRKGVKMPDARRDEYRLFLEFCVAALAARISIFVFTKKYARSTSGA